MPMTSQQICTIAAQMAHAKGMVSLAGEILNGVLSELCQTYDFEVALNTQQVNVGPGGAGSGGGFSGGFSPGFSVQVLTLLGANPGCGPYPLPSNYLRMAQNEALYYVNQVPYVMINIKLAEYDALVQQAGINNFPEFFTTDRSQPPPALYIWPPAGGAYVLQIRYYGQMPDIATPETSSSVPWFPFTAYLYTRVAGEMMKLADDTRWQVFLGASPAGAQGMLDRYLKLQADDEGRAQTVALDRRRFGTPFSRLPNTKLIGW